MSRAPSSPSCRARSSSGTSLLYATLGELVGERAGIVNLGLEGIMLIGASVGFAAASLSGNPYSASPPRRSPGIAANLLFGYVVIDRARQSARRRAQPDVLRPRRERADRPPLRRRPRHRPAALRPAGGRRVRRPGLARRADGARCCGGCCSAPAGAWLCARSARTRPPPSPPATGRTACNIRRWRSAARWAASAARICPSRSPDLGRRHDRRPRLHRHRAGDLRRMESALGGRSARWCSAAPRPCNCSSRRAAPTSRRS